MQTALVLGGKLLQVKKCGTRKPGHEAMVGVPSLPKASKGTQTLPPPIPPRSVHRGVDTQDLTQAMKGLTVSTQTYPEIAGREERGRSVVEAGMGDIKGNQDEILVVGS